MVQLVLSRACMSQGLLSLSHGPDSEERGTGGWEGAQLTPAMPGDVQSTGHHAQLGGESWLGSLLRSGLGTALLVGSNLFICTTCFFLGFISLPPFSSLFFFLIFHYNFFIWVIKLFWSQKIDTIFPAFTPLLFPPPSPWWEGAGGWMWSELPVGFKPCQARVCWNGSWPLLCI